MFINKTIPYITAICLLQLACNSQQAASSTDSATTIANTAEIAPTKAAEGITAQIHQVDSIVSSIKSKQFDHKDAYLPPMQLNDTLFTQLYFNGQVPVKIGYTTFDEGGKPSGIANFYFNDFYSIIHERNFGDEVVYGVVTRNGKYFSFSKANKDGKLKLDETPEEAIDYNTGGFLKYILDLTQLYPDFKFDVPVVDLKGDFALRVVQPVILYAAADTTSAVVGKLRQNTRIGYLQSSTNRIDYRGKSWIWYKVKSGEKIGWVVGHPDWIEEITGEDFDWSIYPTIT